MFYPMIYSLNFICSFSFTLMKHPLAMGLTLLIQTVLITLMSGMLMKTFWFSYILFLIFLGGMLVLFIYVISLASNEMFSFSMKIFISCIFFILFIFIYSLFMDKMMIMNYLKNYELSSMTEQNMFLLENNLILNKLYNFPTNLVTIMLMIYLFLTLIAIVKITNNYEGPLRPQFKK